MRRMNNNKSLISNFLCVLNVVFFLLGDSTAFEFHTLGNYSKKVYNNPKSITAFKGYPSFIPFLTHISAFKDTKTALNNRHSKNTKVKIVFQCLLNLQCN